MALLASAGGEASAQLLTGRVLESGSATPVSGALVELIAADSSRIRAVLSQADGRYVHEVVPDEAVALRVRRIGYLTGVFPLGPDRPAGPFDVRVEVEAFDLDPIVATGSGRCRVDPRTGRETAFLWDQARKALDVAALIHEQRLLQILAVRFRRRLDLERTSLVHESVEVGTIDQPFRSPPAEELQRGGYVQPAPGNESVYYMPDPTVALSDAFLDGHCFRVAEQEGPRGRLVGLAFEPLPDRHLPDVAGVLWLDRGSAELRYLEYEYLGLRPEAEGHAGGWAEFELLADGSWVVRRWVISTPLLDIERGRAERVGYLEEGGVLRAAFNRDNRRLTAEGDHRIEGIVRDGDTGAPIAGAGVSLSGTGELVATGADGRFAFEGLASGDYLVAFAHPRLDTLGVDPPLREVEVPGFDERLLLVTPARLPLRSEQCPGLRESSEGGVLNVQVGDSAGNPVAGATVRIGALAGGATDERGRFRFCGVQPEVEVTVVAELDGSETAPARVRVPRAGFARADLVLDPTG